jgi:hypothetical protein
MISPSRFELIQKNHGQYASWAVWADEGSKPKDNIGDLSIFEVQNRKALLNQLNPNVILVGLNISRRLLKPFGNFHDARPHAMDFKLRYALKGTSLWGGYMTDIIKDFEQKASGKMMDYLRRNKDFELANVVKFRQELRDLGDLNVDKPTIFAFGNDAFKVLDRNLGDEFTVIKLPHYSKYISKEGYRAEIQSIIAEL